MHRLHFRRFVTAGVTNGQILDTMSHKRTASQDLHFLSASCEVSWPVVQLPCMHVWWFCSRLWRIQCAGRCTQYHFTYADKWWCCCSGL